ncbi:FecR family protein [Chitinophaga filiformis]|uniref:FecR domain-containing protein n=1 Tax=Chitinophaga filiformis TaxID=104663 RepID=A0ABY4HW39_CHIFI|nr:FecR domain-containing protein [Chitinophaga filiformis]UPK68001.1 FecR domain-containing protein [Chitinophaga filiformis]
MQIEHELIETLVLKEISGDITSSEAALLSEVLKSDAKARELAEKIRSQVDVIALRNFLLKNDEKVFTQEIITKIQAHKKKRENILRLISISAAASLIIFACIWYFFYNRGSNVPDTTIATRPPSSHDIILSLPNGRRMQLDSTDQKLQVGGIRISTKNRTLTYAANIDASAAEYATLTVPAGRDYKIHLKDGSEIHLNAATKLRFPLTFTGNIREVTIDGEAYLKVAHNTEKPFIVHLPAGTVEVLGTEFNINTYDSAVERISLVSGSLRIKTPASATLLKPGREAVATANDIVVGLFDADEVLAWREGKYYIDNATLAELSAVLSRWYGCTVVVDTKDAASQRFTGILYRSKPVELMLKSIQLTNTIDYSTDEKGIIHIK